MIVRVAVAITLLLAANWSAADPYTDSMQKARTLSDSPRVRLLKFGKTDSERSIPAFVISDFSIDSKDKARILICAGQHGDELDPVKSLFSWCEDLAYGHETETLRKCAVIVIPMVNPDGIAVSTRENASALDTNRDWIALSTTETQFVDDTIRVWKPHLLIDMHNWNEPSPVPGNSIEQPSCSSESRRAAATYAAKQAVRTAGIARIECHPTSDQRLFHRHYSALGYGAYLLETKNGEEYQSRDRIYRAAIQSLITSISNRRDVRLAVSPASKGFEPTAVCAYLEPIHISNATAPSSLTGPIILVAAFVIIACLIKPLEKKEPAPWSRRFVKCSLDCGIGSERVGYRHFHQPITSRSWVNKRLRAKYAVEEEERDNKDHLRSNRKQQVAHPLRVV